METLRHVVVKTEWVLRKHEIPFEIIVVDNGSTDDSVRTISDLNVKILTEDTRGKAQAIRTGIKASSYKYICMIDSDSEYSPEDIPALYHEISEGSDMALGCRVTYPYSISVSSFVANKIVISLIKKFFYAEVPDIFSGIRIFDKEQLQIRANGFIIETDLTVQAITRGLRISSVPVSYKPRQIGKKIGALDFIQILSFLLKERLRDGHSRPAYEISSLYRNP